MKKMQYDYIIVGAGSAGCVLANRLSANASDQVLLIEFGKNNKHILIDMPSALSYPMNMPAFNWGFQSTEEPHLNNRVINCPRGKGLGGTSTINGMVYVRGHACDFDEWHDLGAKGWNYANCLPYFQRAEHWDDKANIYRGKEGPLHVCTGNKMQNPLYKAFINAGIEAGYSQTSDYNGYKQEGFGPMQMTVKNGVRCSTDKAYLNPIKNRKNLTVITQSLADRVLIEKGKAKGIRVISSNNQCIDYYASKEVILSAGAIGSCTILQRSGIGDATKLKKAQIDVINHLPGVGQNLQDHIEIFFQYQCKKPITLNAKLNKRSKLLIGMQWLLLKKGLGATNHFESCAFIRSRSGIKSPDIQYHFLPAAIRYDETQASENHGFQVHVGPNKPKSRGSVTITSPHPLASPTILFNYLQHKEDIRDWRTCVRLTDEILSQPAMDDYRGDIIQPHIDLCSDEAIDTWVRNNAESAYHPCGTCKMGDENDPSAVVDNNCKVIGIDQLRVVDSSVFPRITNGNLNAPTIMVAEKASDIILGNPPLSKPEANVWIPENWETEQRLYPQQL